MTGSKQKRIPSICDCNEHGFVKCTKGYTAMFDPFLLPEVAKWNWSGGFGYAHRRLPKSLDGKTVAMHQMPIGTVFGKQVDHIDGNGMNNRRSNLRHVSKAQNQMNRHAVVAKSGYKGVTNNKKRWAASIRLRTDGVKNHHHLGTFDTREIAALVYDAAAREMFGPYANTNFPQMFEEFH